MQLFGSATHAVPAWPASSLPSSCSQGSPEPIAAVHLAGAHSSTINTRVEIPTAVSLQPLFTIQSLTHTLPSTTPLPSHDFATLFKTLQFIGSCYAIESGTKISATRRSPQIMLNLTARAASQSPTSHITYHPVLPSHSNPQHLTLSRADTRR